MKNKQWTTRNIPDLTGKVMIVTGSNSGLGLEAVRALAGKGATVVMAVRDAARGEQARKALGDLPGRTVVMTLDLTDFSSIRDFATAFQKKFDRLDVLLNNAGVMATPYLTTKEGLELQNATNHFGHFALTGLLIDRILGTPGSRVVSVSSIAHKMGRMDFNNPLYKDGKGYSPAKAYARSKLANLLFTFELQRRFEKQGSGSIAVAAHPGVSSTNLERYAKEKFIFRMIKPLLPLIHQDAATGALPEVRAAADPEVKGGDYYGPGGWMEIKGYPVKVGTSRAALNEKDAEQLWKLSEEITGIHYL